LFPQKGRIASGADADLVIFDPAEPWIIEASNQHSNASYTLFEGREILGRVKKVLSQGKVIVEGQTFQGKAGSARFLPTDTGSWRP
jgi:dihydropyrimidinase